MMKANLKAFETMALLLAFGLGLTGCDRTVNSNMTDDSMNAPMETMDQGTMQEHHEDMSGSMDSMKQGSMDETMPAPMQHTDKDDMHTDMPGGMQ